VNPYLEPILQAATEASHVQLNEQKLIEVARMWSKDDLKIPDWRAPVFPEADDETFIDFLGVGNAINFCFTDPVTKQKYATEYLGTQWSGAFGMWAALKRALEEGIELLNPLYLEDLGENEAGYIFRGSPPLPMLGHRVACLQTAGIAMRYYFGGSYSMFFRGCKFRAFDDGKGIVEKLAEHDPFWWDASPHKPTQTLLQFHKRANLFPMMYQGRALASGGKLRPIIDAEDITPPADYELPKALRHLGILVYGADLALAVDSGQLIPEDSEWEQEIRAQTVRAMLKLCEVLGKPIAAVDYQVWSSGKQSSLPHHLTRTIAY